VGGVLRPRRGPISEPADRSGRVAAKAAPTRGARSTRGSSRGRGFVGGVFRPRQRPASKPADRGGRVAAKAAPTRGRARPADRAWAAVLWEVSSDPDSSGGQCAAPACGPVGSNACLPQGPLPTPAPKTVGSSLLWERARSRLLP